MDEANLKRFFLRAAIGGMTAVISVEPVTELHPKPNSVSFTYVADTLFEAADAALVPAKLVAVTVNV